MTDHALKLENHEVRITKLEKDVDNVETKVDKISEDTAHIRGKFDEIDKRKLEKVMRRKIKPEYKKDAGIISIVSMICIIIIKLIGG